MLHSSQRRRSGSAALALAVLLVAGCQAAPSRPELVSEQAVLLELPLVRQDELYECGLASLSALCQYHGVSIPQAERERLVRLAAERAGLSGGELREALQSLGLEVYIFPGTLDRQETGLFHHIDAGRPLLVMTEERWSSPHYTLVTGYDQPLGNVHVLDPRRGQVVWPLAAFEQIWARSQHFTLLATPPQEGPAGGR
jgi:ABC-type bacteriocin/lantibiotic exporter with double-glycine peptidase domain